MSQYIYIHIIYINIHYIYIYIVCVCVCAFVRVCERGCVCVFTIRQCACANQRNFYERHSTLWKINNIYNKSDATNQTPNYIGSVVCADICADVLPFIIRCLRRDQGLSWHEIHASAASNTRGEASGCQATPPSVLSNLASSSRFFENETQQLPR